MSCEVLPCPWLNIVRETAQYATEVTGAKQNILRHEPAGNSVLDPEVLSVLVTKNERNEVDLLVQRQRMKRILQTSHRLLRTRSLTTPLPYRTGESPGGRHALCCQERG